MSVYIKGMEMPKGLGKTITIYPNGMVRVWVNNKGSGELLEQRAVSVPEHGRLIDADELVADIKGQAERLWTLDSVSEKDYFIERNEKFRQAMFKSWCESLFVYLDTRPTIVKEEENK